MAKLNVSKAAELADGAFLLFCGLSFIFVVWAVVRLYNKASEEFAICATVATKFEQPLQDKIAKECVVEYYKVEG